MNATLREALESNAITAQTAPQRIRISLDWLLAYLGEEPHRGMRFAIGTIRPVVYKIHQGEGQGPKRKVPLSPYSVGDGYLAKFYYATLVPTND